MGTAARNTILILAITCILMPRVFSKSPDRFQEFDSVTYALYEQGRWKELVEVSKEAIREGYDYFYLRLRTGIAWYELGNYMQASIHLEKALEFNPVDRYSQKLLYFAFLEQNKGSEAMKVLDHSSPSLKKELQEESPPRLHFLHLDGGAFFSNQDKEFRKMDLDGKDDLFGVADILNHAYLFSIGGRWFPARWYSGYLGYRYLQLDKNKLVMSGNSIVADHHYQVKQQQIYHSSSFYPGAGISITPAIHYLQYRFTTIFPVYDVSSGEYQLPEGNFTDENYIGFLGIKKDFRIINAGVLAAVANLNGANQYQAGFELTAFPIGNLDLYLHGQYVAHFNDGDFQPVFNAMIGGRVFKPIWLELSGSFGEVENYFENNAYAVYNFVDRLRFKYGAKLIAKLSDRWMFTLDYEYLGKQSYILSYIENNPGNMSVNVPVWRSKDYVDQYLTASILWKL